MMLKTKYIQEIYLEEINGELKYPGTMWATKR